MSPITAQHDPPLMLAFCTQELPVVNLIRESRLGGAMGGIANNHGLINVFERDIIMSNLPKNKINESAVSLVSEQPLNYKFSQETIDSFSELGSVLLRIRKRLISEGYIVVNGKITKNENK